VFQKLCSLVLCIESVGKLLVLFGQDFLREQLFSASSEKTRLDGNAPRARCGPGDCGDHVVIINTRHIAFSGNKWEQKVYSSHTGYPGGFKQVTATQLHLKDPTAIVKLAVYRMLPKNLQRRTMMQRLHLFPEDVIPEDIEKNLLQEIPQPRAVPRRLDEYTPEEIAAFPRVWTPPKDFRRK
uniref:Large ribosomal subunit protein uL13m n=1 Tax=Anas platyrhynchos TaxID=8839 RepID=A0A8B9QN93_ANAPL